MSVCELIGRPTAVYNFNLVRVVNNLLVLCCVLCVVFYAAAPPFGCPGTLPVSSYFYCAQKLYSFYRVHKYLLPVVW